MFLFVRSFVCFTLKVVQEEKNGSPTRHAHGPFGAKRGECWTDHRGVHAGELQSETARGSTRGCRLFHQSFSRRMLQTPGYFCCSRMTLHTGYVVNIFIYLYFCSQQPDIFFSVMSESTWSNVLSDSQRQHLRQFLPQFPDNNISEQDSTINDLFNNRNFNFGNPLHLAQRLFRGVS